MRRLSVVVMLPLAFLLAPAAGLAADTVQPEDKGVQLTAARVSAVAFDGNTMYVAASGHPAKLGEYNVSDGFQRRTVEFPVAEDIWTVTVATDSNVYIGTAGGRLYWYSPTTHLLKKIEIAQTLGTIWMLKPGKDGAIYGATSYEGKTFRAFSYRPGAALALLDVPASAEAATNYVRSLAVDKSAGKLYWGLGRPAGLYQSALDGAVAAAITLPPDPAQPYDPKAYKMTYDLDFIGEKLFVKLAEGPVTKTLVLDKAGNKAGASIENINAVSISPLAPDLKRVFYTKQTSDGSALFSYDVTTGTESARLTGMSQSAGFTFEKQADNKVYLVACMRDAAADGGFYLIKFPVDGSAPQKPYTAFKPPVTATTIRTLLSYGGRVYAAGYLDAGLSTYVDPTGVRQVLTSEKLQAEGLAIHDRKLYAGLYQNAVIRSYELTDAGLVKSTFDDDTLGRLYQQDRPFAMLSLPLLNKLVVGTVPKANGATVTEEGALSIYSFNTNTWDVRKPIIAGQTVLALTHIDNPDDHSTMVYGATSTWGAFGEKPLADETATLFWLNPLSAAKPEQINPVAGKKAITSLINVNDKIWGIAEDTLFIYDPKKPINERVSTLAFDTKFNYSTWTIAWNASSMVQAHNGYVYISLTNQGLYRVNISYPTVIEKVLSGVVGMLTVDDNGDLYYASDARLMKVDLTR
jgi:hypothetical protein